MSAETPWLVVGLGNPGPKYARNRHNVGFMVVDALAAGLVPPLAFKDRFHGHFATVLGSTTASDLPGARGYLLLKPQTFMNRSGDSVAAAVAFHRVPVERVIVVHDEIDFEFGRVAIKSDGGHGGHNGLRDIQQKLASRAFLRVRAGIGRPAHGDVSDFVLADFTGGDAPFVPEMIQRAVRAVKCVIVEGLASAMNQFNQACS